MLETAESEGLELLGLSEKLWNKQLWKPRVLLCSVDFSTKWSRRNRILIVSKKLSLRIHLIQWKRKMLEKWCQKPFLLFKKYTIFSLTVAERKPPSVLSRKYLNKIDEVSTLDCLFELDKIIEAVQFVPMLLYTIRTHSSSENTADKAWRLQDVLEFCLVQYEIQSKAAETFLVELIPFHQGSVGKKESLFLMLQELFVICLTGS